MLVWSAARRTTGQPKARNDTPAPNVRAQSTDNPMNSASCTPTGDGRPGAGGHRIGCSNSAARVITNVSTDTLRTALVMRIKMRRAAYSDKAKGTVLPRKTTVWPGAVRPTQDGEQVSGRHRRH